MSLEEPKWTQYDFSGNYMLFDKQDLIQPNDEKISQNETKPDNKANATRSQYGNKSIDT